jgi:hypothetical protein
MNQVKPISIIRIIISGLLIYSGVYILNQWGKEYDSFAEGWAFIPLIIAIYLLVTEYFILNKKQKPSGKDIKTIVAVGVIGIIVIWFLSTNYGNKRKLESNGIEINAVVFEDEHLKISKWRKSRIISIKYEIDGTTYKQKVSDVGEIFVKGDTLKIKVVKNEPDIYEIPQLDN